MSQNIDVEDSLFISDLEDDLIINDDNKRSNSNTNSEVSSPKRHKSNNENVSFFCKGYLEINEESKYLTINEYGTVLLLNNSASKSVHVNFLNTSIANSYEFDIENADEIDICLLTSSSLVFLNSKKSEITVRSHYEYEKTTSFKITGLNHQDYITSLAYDNKFYVGTKQGMLMVLNDFGILIHKRVFFSDINILDIKFNKLVIIHSDFKRYSILIYSNNSKIIHHNRELPDLIKNSEIKNIGISDNNTPWISTYDGFFSLINSYSQNKSYWVNMLNYENEIYRLNGGFILNQPENEDENYLDNRVYENYYILPVNLISDYDELILGYIINQDSLKLSNINTFNTSSTPITLLELHESIRGNESLDEKDYNNTLNCEIDSKSNLQLPNYYKQVDNMIQNTVQSDVVNASVLENSMLNEDDSVQLLKNLNNAWDSSILRLFDVKCQQNDIKCCYDLVLSLKQLKCLDKAKEISKMYGIYELSDKINDLIDSKTTS